MLDSGILETAIGIAFVFLSVSLICSAVREAIETIMKTRAMDLERGVRELLSDTDGTGLAKDLFNHPRIFALFSGAYDPTKLRGAGKTAAADRMMTFGARQKLPSYIPAAQFSAALIDLVVRKPVAAGDPYPTPALSIDSLRHAASTFDNERVRKAVLSAIDMAAGDLDKVRLELEDWFNGTMDRVSGWYKRRSQFSLFAIGLGAAIVLNVDAITIAKRLGEDETLRKAVVAVSEKSVQTAPPESAASSDIAKIRGEFDQIGLPIGWSGYWPAPQYRVSCNPPAKGANTEVEKGATEVEKGCPLTPGMWLQTAIGWLITAFAAMLGAPFWFDMLNKFMVIRSTVKPHEKSPEEGSEDRQPTPAPVVQAAQKSGAVVAGGGGSGGPAAAEAPPTDYIPNEWKTENATEKEAGLL